MLLRTYAGLNVDDAERVFPQLNTEKIYQKCSLSFSLDTRRREQQAVENIGEAFSAWREAKRLTLNSWD